MIEIMMPAQIEWIMKIERTTTETCESQYEYNNIVSDVRSRCRSQERCKVMTWVYYVIELEGEGGLGRKKKLFNVVSCPA